MFGLIAVLALVYFLDARHQRDVSRSPHLAALATTGLENPQQSLALVVRGIEAARTDQVVGACRAALGKAPLRETLRGHRDYVQYATLSPDGKLVLTASDDVLGLWSASTGKLLDLMDGHTDDVTSAAFSPDGKLIVSTSFDGNALLWSVRSRKKLATLRTSSEEDSVRSAAFSPDGTLLVTANGRTPHVWDIFEHRHRFVLRGHKHEVGTVAFSPDGKLIVTASEDRTAQVWDARTGDPVNVLHAHGGPLSLAAFSPNSRFVATAGKNGTVEGWDPRSGDRVALLRRHTV